MIDLVESERAAYLVRNKTRLGSIANDIVEVLGLLDCFDDVVDTYREADELDPIVDAISAVLAEHLAGQESFHGPLYPPRM